MLFGEIRKQLEGILFDERRADNGDYFEAVIGKNELVKLSGKLEGIFGPPVKTSSDPRVQDKINEFGGVRAGQTLYLWSGQEHSIFAMLWPWQDGWRTTLKIIQK